MKRLLTYMAAGTALALMAGCTRAASPAPAAAPEPAQARPLFTAEGTVQVPAFELPPSLLSSPEAQAMMRMRAKMPAHMPQMEMDISKSRARLAAMLAPQVAALQKDFPVDVAETTIAGVPARIVTPKGKAGTANRVLINLHGGAFNTCWEACSLIESVPIAALGGYKVVSVNYRMAPEHKHPAGVQDVEAVYRDLLKTYKPSQIGIFGCSAGGALTAQAAAWLPEQGLPQPAAIGIFGAGAARFGAGDSAYIAANIDGTFPGPAKEGAPAIDMTRGYFDGTELSDRIVSPAAHADVMAKFPPSLIITGTRAMDMSPAIYTNSQLIKAGVRSTLIVGEGMGHCYIYQHTLPEAQDAYKAIIGFFGANLR